MRGRPVASSDALATPARALAACAANRRAGAAALRVFAVRGSRAKKLRGVARPRCEAAGPFESGADRFLEADRQ